MEAIIFFPWPGSMPTLCLGGVHYLFPQNCLLSKHPPENIETSDVLRRVSVLWRTVHPGVTMTHWTVNQAGIQAHPCHLRTEMMCPYILICMQDGGVGESSYMSEFLSFDVLFSIITRYYLHQLWGFQTFSCIYRLCLDCWPLILFSHACYFFSIYNILFKKVTYYYWLCMMMIVCVCERACVHVCV